MRIGTVPTAAPAGTPYGRKPAPEPAAAGSERGQWIEHRSGARNLAIVLALLLCASATGVELTGAGNRWAWISCLGLGVIEGALAMALQLGRLGPQAAAWACTAGAVLAVIIAPLTWGTLPDDAGKAFAAQIALLMFVAAPLGLQAFSMWANLAYPFATALGLAIVPSLLGTAGPLDSSGIIGATLVALAVQGALSRHRGRQRQLTSAAQDLALVDPLSEAYQRCFFLPLLAQEALRSSRMNISASIALVDIDHLERINLSHGSAGGDRAIRSVVDRIRGASRGIDVVGRWSGATFAVLLPGSTLSQAGVVAERIRTQVERSPVYLANGNRLSITVSIGVSQLRQLNDTETLWLSRADMAMHRAKAQGRNRVALDAAYFAPR